MEKSKITLPVKVVIIGCIIGLLFVGFGVFKQFDAKKVNQERADEALKASEKAVAAANARLKEIEKEYYPLKEQYESKKRQCDSMNITDPNFFAANSACMDEVTSMHSKMVSLEMEDTAIKTKDYTVFYQKVKPMSYQIFYIIGASIAGLAILAAFIIYLVKGKKSYN